MLDKRSEDLWAEPDFNKIVEIFGYAVNEEFIDALNAFIDQSAKNARIKLFLGIFAKKHFKNWSPPLTKNGQK